MSLARNIQKGKFNPWYVGKTRQRTNWDRSDFRRRRPYGSTSKYEPHHGSNVSYITVGSTIVRRKENLV